MIYTSARFSNAEHTLVTGTDANGNTETVPADHTMFRQPDDGPVGFVANGGVIAPYVQPPTPLPDLEPWRFFAMLDLSGKRPTLEAFIDGLPEPGKTVARNQFEKSLVFRRGNDLVLAVQQAMSMTDEQLDTLWSQALTL